jgi:hypothetical protein
MNSDARLSIETATQLAGGPQAQRGLMILWPSDVDKAQRALKNL